MLFTEGEDISGPWTSIERQDLMRKFYPELVEKYEESIKKPPKEKKTKGRKKKENADKQQQNDKPKRKYNRKPKQPKDAALSELNVSMKNLSFTNKEFNSSKAKLSVSINKLKRKIRNTAKSKVKNTIDSYLITHPPKKRKSSKLMNSLRDSFRNMSLRNNDSFNFGPLDAVSGNKENIIEDKHSFRNTSLLNNDSFSFDPLDAGGGNKENLKEAKHRFRHMSFLNNDSFNFDPLDAGSGNKENPKEDKHSFRHLSLLNNDSFNFDHLEADSDKENIKEDKHLLSMLNKSEESIDETDLSAIVDNIVSRAPTVTTAKVNSNFVKLIFESKQLPRKSILTQRFKQNNCSTPKNSPVRKSRRSSISKANTSYFFDILTDERDAFEISVEYKLETAPINLDCDATLEYSLHDV